MSFSFLQQGQGSTGFNYALNSQNYELDKGPVIVVIGVGGAGCNAVNNMIEKGLTGVRFCVANTDNQSLNLSLCSNKIQLGSSLTNGLGAGSSPQIGEQAARESEAQINEAIKDANMIFITAGMGGGTGTGAAPVIAEIARSKGILTIGVVTKPFQFEKDKRMKTAEAGVEQMNRSTDTLIVISNQNVFRVANELTTLTNAFSSVDDVLFSGIRCITDLVTKAGIVNLDFADVASVMSHGGRSVMGEGEAEGEDRAIKAAERAITNPILEYSSVKGAKGMLINITGGDDMTLFEVNDAIDRITKEIDPNATMKFGSTISPELNGVIRVSVVATGVDSGPDGKKEVPRFNEPTMFANIAVQQKNSNSQPNLSHFTGESDSDFVKKEEIPIKSTTSGMSGIVDFTKTGQIHPMGAFAINQNRQNFGIQIPSDLNLVQQKSEADNVTEIQDNETQSKEDSHLKSLATIRKIEKQSPHVHQEQPKMHQTATISRKIILENEDSDDGEDIASNGIDKITSFFARMRKGKK